MQRLFPDEDAQPSPMRQSLRQVEAAAAMQGWLSVGISYNTYAYVLCFGQIHPANNK